MNRCDECGLNKKEWGLDEMCPRCKYNGKLYALDGIAWNRRADKGIMSDDEFSKTTYQEGYEAGRRERWHSTLFESVSKNDYGIIKTIESERFD